MRTVCQREREDPEERTRGLGKAFQSIHRPPRRAGAHKGNKEEYYRRLVLVLPRRKRRASLHGEGDEAFQINCSTKVKRESWKGSREGRVHFGPGEVSSFRDVQEGRESKRKEGEIRFYEDGLDWYTYRE